MAELVVSPETEGRTEALTRALDSLAILYLYPNPGLCDAAKELSSDIAKSCPEAAALLEPLIAHLGSSELAACEELFVRTFELNPTCALEVGWQKFGEQYARGAFLVRMRALMRQAGLAETTELPDHLPNVLRVITRVDDEAASKLVTRFTLPALATMREKFGEEATSPYVGLLEATSLVLQRHYGAEESGAEESGAEVNHE